MSESRTIVLSRSLLTPLKRTNAADSERIVVFSRAFCTFHADCAIAVQSLRMTSRLDGSGINGLSHVGLRVMNEGFSGYKRILTATDFSETADSALRRAVWVAQQSCKRLVVAHVVI